MYIIWLIWIYIIWLIWVYIIWLICGVKETSKISCDGKIKLTGTAMKKMLHVNKITSDVVGFEIWMSSSENETKKA